MTSNPASRSARAITLAPRSCPSRPGLAIRTRMGGRSGIVVEPGSPFAAEFAGGDHPAEQRSGPVFVVAQVALERFENVETNVEPDQIGQRERPHWMIRAEFHRRVDRLGSGDAFREA